MLRKRRRNQDGCVRVTFELPAEAGGEVVHLVGDFTDWQGKAMQRREDGSWTTSVDLEPGRSYQFRYLVDGERWENDWQADRYVPGPFGSENSVVETPALETRSRGASGGSGSGNGSSARIGKASGRSAGTPKKGSSTGRGPGSAKSRKGGHRGAGGGSSGA